MLFILAYHYWIMAVFAIHYMVSVLHIVVLQVILFSGTFNTTSSGIQCEVFVVIEMQTCAERSYFKSFYSEQFLIQPLEIGSNWKFMETGLVAVCAAVHLFAPYNMVEGRSRYRYIVAYCIEAIEIVVSLSF